MKHLKIYNTEILKHFDNWYKDTNNDLLFLDSICNQYHKKLQFINNNNYSNFIKKKKIQYYKPKNFSSSFLKKNNIERNSYDLFFSIEGLLKFKEKFNKNKNKFFLTYEFGEKLKITFNDSELFRHKKKFNDFKINDTLTFIFFFKKNFFLYKNLYSGISNYKFTSWRQFFIIPINLYYQNHLYNITKNDYRFDELRQNSLFNFFKLNNYKLKKPINLIFTNYLNLKIKKRHFWLTNILRYRLYNNLSLLLHITSLCFNIKYTLNINLIMLNIKYNIKIKKIFINAF